MQCPKCGSSEKSKAGFIGDKQRYQCKNALVNIHDPPQKALVPLRGNWQKSFICQGFHYVKSENSLGFLRLPY
jgi:hypothetical protein